MKQVKTRQELIKLYLDFYKSKNHKVIPSASLIPENDPTVLFTTAGMHPLVPYILGQKHPLGKRIVDVQKCIRTQDINEVGDPVHNTFFEMLGNWSLGDYWKEEAIKFTFEFHTKILGIPLEKYAVSVFKGDNLVKRDEESAKVWLSLGIPKDKIAYLGKDDNWWGPAGEYGPCGPDTEQFFWTGKEKAPKKFNPKDKNWVEIGNDVLMEYNKDKRVILVDGMECLYDENFKINRELLDIIHSFNSHYILTINGFKEKGRNLVKNTNYDTNWEAFSLEERGIKKDDPKYFKILLEKFNLNPDDILYFDHSKDNINSANKFGIKNTLLYTGNNNKVKEFMGKNLLYYKKASQKNVDFGGGVERTLTVLNGLDDIYLTTIFQPIIKEIEKISNKIYSKEENKKTMRIIADHIKAATFILGDPRGIKPSNAGQGYVLRRLIRRAIRYGKLLGIKDNFTGKIAISVIPVYPDYPELKQNKAFIINELDLEETRFNQTLQIGLKKFSEISKSKKEISGKDAFLLFQSYGFPIEMTEELAKEKKLEVNISDYNKEFEKHQELSRTSSAGMFKSGLADNSEQTKKLHTATHLLNEAIRIILKDSNIKQKGSNITPERLRFDFNFIRKLKEEEVGKIENLVNEKIKEELNVTKEEMPLTQAIKSGAQGEFGMKYPDIVSVYTITDKKDKKGFFSKEICTGPHVSNTKEIGHFKIIKEESVAAGIRRIKAVVE